MFGFDNLPPLHTSRGLTNGLRGWFYEFSSLDKIIYRLACMCNVTYIVENNVVHKKNSLRFPQKYIIFYEKN